MKKLILTIILVASLIVSMTGCTSSSNDQVEVVENSGHEIYSVDLTTAGNNKLVYDINTKIVYISQYTYNGNRIYTLYTSENGFPYRYVDGRLVEVTH